MERKKLMVVSSLTASAWMLFPAVSEAVELTDTLNFTGYGRAGAGRSTSGGGQQCFQLPGAGAKYRLGNECEQYGEFELNQQIFSGTEGSRVSIDGMASLYNAYNHSLQFSGGNGNARLPQLYINYQHVPGLHGGGVWAGRRYYKRQDIHISDFYFWNPSGTGFGIEDVNVGGVKLSYALSRKDNIGQEESANRHDFQVNDIYAGTNAKLDMGLSVIQKGSRHDQHGGWSITTMHTLKHSFGGANKLALQYGVGPGTGLGGTGDLYSGSDVKRWRLVESTDWQMTPSFGGQALLVYQRDSGGHAGQTWWSAGARMAYAVTDRFKMLAEFGHDRVTPDNASTRTLNKLTIAPAWSQKREFWSRPEVRFYLTMARWNKAAQGAAAKNSVLSASGPFGDRTEGASIGIQIEHWWK